MWFIKTPIRKQIDHYGKDTEMLLEFAKFVKKPKIQEITQEDIKLFYTGIVAPKNSHWERDKYMLSIRKFFKHCRGDNVLKWQSVTNDPLQNVENISMMQEMPKAVIKKRGAGRPRDIASIRKVVAMRNEGITFRQIALALKKDVSQVHVWWKDREHAKVEVIHR